MVLTADSWGPHSPDAYVSNGLIGFRFPKDPFREVLGLMSGFTTLREKIQVEALAVLPAPVIGFSLDGESADPETVSQSYDLSNGEFTTKAVLKAAGKEVSVVYTVYCSRTSPTLLMSHIFYSGDPCEMAVSVSYASRSGYGYTLGEGKPFEGYGLFDGKCLWPSSDGTSAAGAAFSLTGDIEKTPDGPMRVTARAKVGEAESEMRLITSYVPSVLHSEPHNQAQRMIQLASWQGAERLREANRESWAELWESRITVEGAGEDWQKAIDASFFNLMTSVSPFSPASVAPFALSNADEYEGHFFWDTESFMFMPPLFFSPETARSMLDYRSKRIGAAENNAKINGYLGIQFPWQSGSTGCEVTVPWCTQAGEQHVSLDIAMAFDVYARVTGDAEFARESAWPVLRGVSRWIESRVTKTARGYEILNITGIDEGRDNVSNDSYCNIMAAKVLRSAAEMSEMLGYGERPNWREISEKLFIPVRPDGVLEQYEGMPDMETVPPVCLMSLFPYGFEGADIQKTLEYYISHGMKESCKWPMLGNFLGVFPAWNGDPEKSRELYDDSTLEFFCGPFYSCTESAVKDPAARTIPNKELDTDFITNCAALLMGLVMGLTKMCPWRGRENGDINEWFGENIVLPSGWKKITVGKVFIRGRSYRLTAADGAKRAELEEIEA